MNVPVESMQTGTTLLVRTSCKRSGFFATSTWKTLRRERYTPVRLALATALGNTKFETNASCRRRSVHRNVVQGMTLTDAERGRFHCLQPVETLGMPRFVRYQQLDVKANFSFPRHS